MGNTGAAISVISENLYKCKLKKVKLIPTNCVLRSYRKHFLHLYENEAQLKQLLVVKGNGPTFLTETLHQKLKLDWSSVIT